ADRTDERVGPERCWLREDHLDRMIVDLFDLDILVAADRDRSRLGILRIFPVEHHVVGREWRAVMPFDALLQLPDHREAVFLETVIVLARNLGRENRNQIALAVPSRQRFIEYARRL